MGMSESPTWSQLKKHNMFAGEFNHFAVTCFRAHVHDRFTWSVFMLGSALLSKLYVLTSSGTVWTASYVEVMLYARLKPCGGRAARQWLFLLLPTGGRCCAHCKIHIQIHCPLSDNVSWHRNMRSMVAVPHPDRNGAYNNDNRFELLFGLSRCEACFPVVRVIRYPGTGCSREQKCHENDTYNHFSLLMRSKIISTFERFWLLCLLDVFIIAIEQ